MSPSIAINHHHSQRKPAVGISACLCGDKVRYDGRSKGQPGLISALEPYLELHKVCPEVAIGMGVPRAPIQLTKNAGRVQARGVKDPAYNVTQKLTDYATQLIGSTSLCGYILKSRSPSCGVGSTPIHQHNIAVGFGDGIFAHQLQQQRPWLPVVEELQLVEPHQQQHFVLLSQLVDLFFNASENTQLVSFHASVTPYRKLLTATIQQQLMDLVHDSSSIEPTYYLTLLIQGLQRRTLQPT